MSYAFFRILISLAIFFPTSACFSQDCDPLLKSGDPLADAQRQEMIRAALVQTGGSSYPSAALYPFDLFKYIFSSGRAAYPFDAFEHSIRYNGWLYRLYEGWTNEGSMADPDPSDHGSAYWNGAGLAQIDDLALRIRGLHSQTQAQRRKTATDFLNAVLKVIEERRGLWELNRNTDYLGPRAQLNFFLAIKGFGPEIPNPVVDKIIQEIQFHYMDILLHMLFSSDPSKTGAQIDILEGRIAGVFENLSDLRKAYVRSRGFSEGAFDTPIAREFTVYSSFRQVLTYFGGSSYTGRTIHTKLPNIFESSYNRNKPNDFTVSTAISSVWNPNVNQVIENLNRLSPVHAIHLGYPEMLHLSPIRAYSHPRQLSESAKSGVAGLIPQVRATAEAFVSGDFREADRQKFVTAIKELHRIIYVDAGNVMLAATHLNDEQQRQVLAGDTIPYDMYASALWLKDRSRKLLDILDDPRISENIKPYLRFSLQLALDYFTTRLNWMDEAYQEFDFLEPLLRDVTNLWYIPDYSRVGGDRSPTPKEFDETARSLAMRAIETIPARRP